MGDEKEMRMAQVISQRTASLIKRWAALNKGNEHWPEGYQGIIHKKWLPKKSLKSRRQRTAKTKHHLSITYNPWISPDHLNNSLPREPSSSDPLMLAQYFAIAASFAITPILGIFHCRVPGLKVASLWAGTSGHCESCNYLLSANGTLTRILRSSKLSMNRWGRADHELLPFLAISMSWATKHVLPW